MFRSRDHANLPLSLTRRDRHDINNYSQLPSMPPKRIQRSQLHMPNTRASIESLRASLSRITPIRTDRVSVLPEDEINDDNPAETHVHQEARDPDDKDEDEDEDDSTLPEGEDNRGRDDILSKITEDDQKEMLEQNWMVFKLLFEQEAELKEERTQMLTELDRSRTIDRPENPGNQSKIFKMVEPLRYCGRAKELDKLLETL